MSDKLTKLRSLFSKHNINAYLIPSEDAHQSEYTGDCDRRRAFISNFTGSAGFAIVTDNQAALWTDGRYFNQASKELDANWTLMKAGLPGVPTKEEWLGKVLQPNGRLGVDPKLVSAEKAEKLKSDLVEKNLDLVAIQENLIDSIWETRPERKLSSVFVLSDEFAGKSSQDKINDLVKTLKEKEYGLMVVCALDEIAWLFNLRGSDIECNPVFYAYATITADSEIVLYCEELRLSKEALDSLKNVTIRPYDAVFDDIAKFSNGKILCSKSASWALKLASRDLGAIDTSPLELSKAVKNETELKGFRDCHVRDGAALCMYFGWLENELCVKKNTLLNECIAADKLETFRSTQRHFMGVSFDTISAVGANAAVIHYKPEESTAATINTNEIYLCDSGGQYLDGTTDVTRTLHFGTPSDFEKQCFTLVLKGNINLDQAVFPKGVNGYQLDSIARMPLWSKGLDYRHGTGHGVGHFLNVHEGPHGIGGRSTFSQVALQEGMVVSNEPGYYEDGKFGIRIENIDLVQKAKTEKQFNDTQYFTFECVTMCPMQQKMFDFTLLSNVEIDWLNSYNKKIREKVSPLLQGVKGIDPKYLKMGYEWMMKETAEIPRKK